MDKLRYINEGTQIREIILLEIDKNKKGDLFNRLAFDVFHALGFGEPRFNIPKAGREIDLVLQHRTENRVALAECKAHADKVGGADVNKFIGAFDVERGKYEREGISVVGYFVSQSGFKGTVYEQEEERVKARKERNENHEMILLGPDGIVRELIQGHVICSLEQAVSTVKIQGEELYLCEQADLLACEEGWIWVLYYARFPKQMATHFAFVHADGNQLLDSIADTILQRAKLQKTVFTELSYLKAPQEQNFNEVQNAYFQYLKNELSEIQFEGMPADKEAGAVKVDLENIFVPLQFRYSGMDKNRKEIDQNVSIREILDRSLRAAILAKPGRGKSMLIRRIALAYAYPKRRLWVNDDLPEKDWFPVYIRCRDLESNADKSIMELIGMIAQKAEISQYESLFKGLIENALQDGRVLLLIDGLDEIAREKYRICFANQLRTFVATYPGIHLIITSREAGFRSVAGTIATYCEQYAINGLKKEQIRLLSRKWHQVILGDSRQVESDSDKLCDMILGNARIVALAENPLLLTALLFVKRCVGYLPTKRCRLYEEMIRLLLVTWNAVAYDKLDMDETEPQLAFVAYCMMERGQQKITRDDLENCIIKARKELPEILDYTNVSPSRFIKQVEERSSLLIQMGFEENELGQMVAAYEFSHLSFQEYLAAKAIVKQWIPDSRNMNLLKALKPHLEEEHWREVIPLAAFLSGRDAQLLVEYLIKQNGEYEVVDGNDINYDERIQEHSIIYTLHLANCIANEVPINQNLLKKSLLLILKGRYIIKRIKRGYYVLDMFGLLDVIARSKYGNSYLQIAKEKLFEYYEDKYSYEFPENWMEIYCMGLQCLRYENGYQLDHILSLLLSEDYQNKVTGALLMMMTASSYVLDKSNYKLNKLKLKEIFFAINQMLKSKDELSVYSASWCVAWAGYGGANMIASGIAMDIANRLLDLWMTDIPVSSKLKSKISPALVNVCMPGIEIQRKSGLAEVIEENFNHPQNDWDQIAAVNVAVITNVWSKEEVKQRLEEQNVKELRVRFSRDRFLNEMGILPLNK